MILRALTNQLIRDLKSSWKKTAALGVLFAVGLIFWIPPLVRALHSESPAMPNPAENRALPELQPIEAEASFRIDLDATGKMRTDRVTWNNVDEILDRDPLVRSVEVAAIQSDPFLIDQDQFSPPVLFADESVDAPKPTAAGTTATTLPEGLVLKSTIVGVHRRAAYINTKLYFEGTQVRGEDGRTYELTAIHPRKVVLKQGNRTFELRIADRNTAEKIEFGRQVTDD